MSCDKKFSNSYNWAHHIKEVHDKIKEKINCINFLLFSYPGCCRRRRHRRGRLWPKLDGF